MLTLVVADKLISEEGPAYAFLAWLAIVAVICIVLSVSNYILIHYVQTSKETGLKLKILESETFALGLSYTFTLITLGGICGESFIGFLVTIDDDGGNSRKKNICSSIDFLFSISNLPISLLPLIICTWYGR